jgi:hypothetical protein
MATTSAAPPASAPLPADDAAALAGALRTLDLRDVLDAALDACLARLEGLAAEVGRCGSDAER